MLINFDDSTKLFKCHNSIFWFTYKKTRENFISCQHLQKVSNRMSSSFLNKDSSCEQSSLNPLTICRLCAISSSFSFHISFPLLLTLRFSYFQMFSTNKEQTAEDCGFCIWTFYGAFPLLQGIVQKTREVWNCHWK